MTHASPAPLHPGAELQGPSAPLVCLRVCVLVCFLVGATIGLLACSGAWRSVPDQLLFDPLVASTDLSAPFTLFDGAAGSLLLGEGWSPLRQHDVGSESWHSSWVVGRTAELSFQGPVGPEVDLWGWCEPFTWPTAPEQKLTVILNGEPAGSTVLPRGWSELRVPLSIPPAGALNVLRLELAYDQEPRLVRESGDSRRLSVRCRSLGVIPRSTRDPGWYVHALARAPLPEHREIRLPPGGSYSVLVGPHRRYRLLLGPVESECADCRLTISTTTSHGPDRLLWAGRPADASSRRIGFRTDPVAVGRLELEVLSPLEGTDRGETTLTLSANALRWKERLRLLPRAEPTNVFVYVVDTLRADALQAYGGRDGASPRSLELARDSVVYEEAWSASSWTLPATVSLLTGLYPSAHGVMKGDVKLAEGTPTLPRLLRAEGYDTIGVSHSYVVSDRFGAADGFETFVLSDQLHGWTLASQMAARTLFQRLETRPSPDSPVMAYLHTVDTHAPYAPPECCRSWAVENPGSLDPRDYLPHLFIQRGLGERPDEVAHLRGLYQGAVQYADQQLGRFLDALDYVGLYQESLLIVVSDHGEEFGEHGGFDHGRTAYQEIVRVPLIVKYPRQRWSGRRIATRVSTVDVVPTVLETVGASYAGTLDGASLTPWRVEPRRIVRSEVAPAASQLLAAVDYRSTALGSMKCIQNRVGIDQFGRTAPRWLVFDLQDDPQERRPLASSDAVLACRNLVASWPAARRSNPARPEPTDGEALERLRALGYLR